MTLDNSILVGSFEGFSWIRCEGKGSFINSPGVRNFGDERISAGETCVVIDLEACTGMDSTFMGTLAGLATRLAATPGGTVQVTGTNDRNRRSLEDLGLDFLMEIEPSTAPWLGREEALRSTLQAPQTRRPIGQIQRARHVLEAHHNLTEVSEENTRKFADVVAMLESELASKQAQGPPPEPEAQ